MTDWLKFIGGCVGFVLLWAATGALIGLAFKAAQWVIQL